MKNFLRSCVLLTTICLFLPGCGDRKRRPSAPTDPKGLDVAKWDQTGWDNSVWGN